MRDAQPLVCKLLALLLVQHHAVSKPAVLVVPLHLPAAGKVVVGERGNQQKRGREARRGEGGEEAHAWQHVGMLSRVAVPPQPSGAFQACSSAIHSLQVAPWAAAVGLLAVLNVLDVLRQVGVQPHLLVLPRQLGGCGREGS